MGSFEGIRAQDILPLLVERFTFDEFIGFGNVIDPFVDRSFGPNFDIASPKISRSWAACTQRTRKHLRRATSSLCTCSR